MSRSGVLTCAILLAAACNGEPDTASDVWPDVLISEFDTVVSANMEAVGEIADLEVGSDGRLWIADDGNQQLVVLDPASGQMRAFGREGEGPGDVRRPVAIAVAGPNVLVLEAGNSRVQYFTPQGETVGQFTLGTFVMSPATLNVRGDVAMPTLGHDSSLVAIFTDSGRTRLARGSPVVPPPTVMRISALREQVLRGEVPVEFRNNVLPALGPEGEVWLILQAEGEVQHFDPTGTLLWRHQLPDSVVSTARTSYLNEAAAETDPTRIHVPQVVSAARLEGEELWLMLASGESRRSGLLILNSVTGAIRARIRVDVFGAGQFAVDRKNARLYIALAAEGIVIAADLPDR